MLTGWACLQARAKPGKPADRLAETEDDSGLSLEHDDAAEPIIIDSADEEYESADGHAELPKGEQHMRCAMPPSVWGYCMSAFRKNMLLSAKLLAEHTMHIPGAHFQGKEASGSEDVNDFIDEDGYEEVDDGYASSPRYLRGCGMKGPHSKKCCCLFTL